MNRKAPRTNTEHPPPASSKRLTDHLSDGGHNGEQPPIAAKAGPDPDAAREGEHEIAGQSLLHRPGDAEFESFHRSFAIIGPNQLDSRASITPYLHLLNSGDGPGSMISIAAPVAGEANQTGGSSQEQEQLSSSSPPPSQPEDPTIVQARRSMMRRTGDRHARGKLPESKEGRYLPPDCLPLDPRIPAPRSSKRYMKHKKRSPDVFEGSARSDDVKSLKDDEHIVSCRGCNLNVVVRKAAVLVRCKNCDRVTPASSVIKRFYQSQFAPS
jgi:hypothetical protein